MMIVSGKISVVMPAYNESVHILRNLRETIATLSDLGYDYEIVLVDDGSSDATHLEAGKIHAESVDRVRVIRYERNAGKGNAVMCGASFATGAYIVILDADMDLHPAQLPVLFGVMKGSGADVVIGSKRHPLSKINYPLKRKLYSAIYFGLIRLLFGLPLRDTQTGIKIFRREVVENVFPRLLSKRFAFDIEVLANAHRLGFKICESPVTLTFNREFGRIGASDVFFVVRDTLAIFYRMHILRYYDRVPHGNLRDLGRVSAAREIVPSFEVR
jgi:glycosyltransferase involved in cell wall biosynthesis